VPKTNPKAVIAGWGHTQFGRLEDQDTESLVLSAGRMALEHAGLPPCELEGIWLGQFEAGLDVGSFHSSLALGIDPAMRFIPATRCENACASGSAAIYAARNAIAAGEVKTALVIGVEKMTHRSTKEVAACLARAAYAKEEGNLSFPQIFAEFAKAYFAEYGDCSDALAHIAAKNHRNALDNPLAHMRKDVGFAFCNTLSEKNPVIADPLRLTDCSLVTDGAAALVLVADDMRHAFPQAVEFRAAVQVNDFLPMSRRKLTDFAGPTKAIKDACTAAGVDSKDLDFAEVHDCFTIAELLIYEAMGLAPKGQGRKAIDEGVVMADGSLPVNRSGGLKAKGHPVGATGVSMHVMAAKQLTGQAGDLQLPGAELGLVFNMGGSAVANYASILQPVA